MHHVCIRKKILPIITPSFTFCFTVQPCLQSHIPTGSNPENETCDTTESSDLKLCSCK
jgi:hypothetical protein